MKTPKIPLLLLVCALAVSATGCIGFGLMMMDMDKWPGSGTPAPKSRASIARLSSGTIELELSWLKGKDFPALKKFHKLQTVTFRRGNATDAKLETLAGLGFTNLQSVRLPNCSHVTDRGIETLSRIPSIRSLNLRDTPITDAGAEVIASNLQLTRLQVCKCTNLTARGLLRLAETQPLEYLEFSCENLTETDVIRIFQASSKLKNVHICLPSRVVVSQAVTPTWSRGVKLVFEGITFWHGDSLPDHFQKYPPLSPE